MRLCVPTEDDRGLAATMAEHFGRAPFFTFVDVGGGVDDDTARVVRNPDCHAHTGGCHHVPILEAHGADAVVCRGIGRRAAAALIEAGIAVHAPSARTVADIVTEFRQGRARALAPDAFCTGGGHGSHGRHRHGHGTRGAA